MSDSGSLLYGIGHMALKMVRLAPYSIGSTNDRLFHLTNWHVVLMGLTSCMDGVNVWWGNVD